MSELKINCDYASRGCPEFTCLEDLETHVVNCGYAPVLCSNAECGMEINKQNKVHHETEVCEHRRVKCHECGQKQEDMGMLKESFMALDGKVETAVKEINKNIEAVKKINREISIEVEPGQKINEKVEASRKELGEVNKDVKDMKGKFFKMNKDVDEVKVMMTQVLERLDMLELLIKLPSPVEGMLDTPGQYILVAGGNQERDSNRSTEIYSWEKSGWFKVSPMNERHGAGASFIDEDQLFVVGDWRNSKTIESLDINKLPLKWKKFPGELQFLMCGMIIKLSFASRVSFTLVDIIMVKADRLPWSVTCNLLHLAP